MTKIKIIDGTAYRLVRVAERPGRPPKELSPVLLATLIFERQTNTIKELAEKYDVSESTMNRWLRKARAAYDKEASQS